jgi:metal transporter CNNM
MSLSPAFQVSWITWIGILACLTQSATLSGLNLACFRSSRLHLEMEAAQGNPDAGRLLELRRDANFLLVTILWGNVAVNVILALLSGSVMAGVSAFLFSTVVITIAGEILPQAYASRHALRMAAALSPVLRFYQVLLYPVARPTAWVLDRWLGKEAVVYYEEEDLRDLLRMHARAAATEIGRMEGTGALNFLDLDDLPVSEEGEPVDPGSLVRIPFRDRRPIFPRLSGELSDPFIQAVIRSGRRWVVLTDEADEAHLVLDAGAFLRDVLLGAGSAQPHRHCHRPIIVHDGGITLGRLVPRFRVHPRHAEDDVVDEDIILLWGRERRIITGSDLLGRLLRGIVVREEEGSAGADQRAPAPA